MMAARSITVRGIVQGVGFRPYVYRLARANTLAGWVSNQSGGVTIHLEGDDRDLDLFLNALPSQAPKAAQITAIEVRAAEIEGCGEFIIRETRRGTAPTVRISPDLPVCADCLREMRDPDDPRYRYAYINCTNCGPRYTIIERLPYDRVNTTMRRWPMDALCGDEYADPSNRRFHAQPIACPECGPQYHIVTDGRTIDARWPGIVEAARMLRRGSLVAVKGIGGYHLACDARNQESVRRLRQRKFRKEKPFALMPRTVEIARTVASITAGAEDLMGSPARPIVLAPKRAELPGVAPDNNEYGLMLPYAPLHHLLFDAGAPDLLVMTSANRASEPIAYRDDESQDRLGGIAEAFLIGERPIARRVDDSVAREGPFGPVVLRRSRGYAPRAVTVIPCAQPVLALGADLKNAVTLVVDGQAFVSQHVGDLDDHESRLAFEQTIRDLTEMYDVDWNQVVLAYDAHPEYASTLHAFGLSCARRVAVQHHRAHIASVVAERQAWHERVIGVSLDGTGYGDDATIWGGEFFVGSIAGGLARVAHLRKTPLAGGDAAARYPVQAAAGFLSQVDHLPDLSRAPFHFPDRYGRAMQLIAKRVRTFETTSAGRLFDTAAALCGFTREITFEGQAAMWLEHVANNAQGDRRYPCPLAGDEVDWRPLLEALIRDRIAGVPVPEIARAFHCGVAAGLCDAARVVAAEYRAGTLVLSGGVFQNQLLMAQVKSRFGEVAVWTNHAVPPNDGGISLGQAALAAFNPG